MPRRRTISDVAAGPPPAPGSIFGPEDDNVVPGEVVLALEADAAAAVATSVPQLPTRAGAGATVTEVGHSALDQALQRLQVDTLTRVHGAMPPTVVDGIAMADETGLDGTLRIRYAADVAPAEAAEQLAGLAEVAWAEPNRWREASVVPNDPQFASQWGLTSINCPPAWDITTGDPGVTVAVVDTGVDLTHPELAALLLAGQDLVDFPVGSTPQPGWVFEGDYTGVDADPTDEVGHGTHVAGTICCASNNAVGVAGVSWNVRLMPVRVLARAREVATGRISGLGSAANIAAGIRWAVDHGARIISMSLGGYGDTTVEREAVAYAVSHNVVVVAAMGNDNTTNPSYPAAYPGVIAVAATDSADRRASFSNRGPHCAVSAPGVGVLSTFMGGGYATMSGTSMATPHVSGVAALILSRNSSLTADRVGNIIRTTARALRDNPTDPVPNDSYGSGLVQADAAVRAAAPVVASRVILCGPSVRVACPSLAICPSVGALCPSVAVCPSRTVVCQPSVATVCQPSVHLICPSAAICPSLPPACVASQLACPTLACPTLACPTLACPGSLACGPGNPAPGPASAEEWEGYDPHGYDPYGSTYE